MERWQMALVGLLFAAGPAVVAADLRLGSTPFRDAATMRYYEQNRQYYESQDAYQRSMTNRYQSNRQQVHLQSKPTRRINRTPRYHAVQETPTMRLGKHYQPNLMPDQMPAGSEKMFVFNPRILTWAAYDANGDLVRKGRGSGGQSYCSDIRRGCRTPTGEFRVTTKRGAECKSSIYPKPTGGAKMPNCMFFHKNFAVHGSPFVPGYNASHGCVRVFPTDAAWLNQHFMNIGTKVIIHSY